MQAGAVANFLERACRGDVRPPAFEVGEDGPYFRDGVLYLRAEDGWDVVSRVLVSALLHAVAAGEIAPDSSELEHTFSVTARYAGIKCPGNFEKGRDGKPPCTNVISFPGNCSACYRSIK